MKLKMHVQEQNTQSNLKYIWIEFQIHVYYIFVTLEVITYFFYTLTHFTDKYDIK